MFSECLISTPRWHVVTCPTKRRRPVIHISLLTRVTCQHGLARRILGRGSGFGVYFSQMSMSFAPGTSNSSCAYLVLSFYQSRPRAIAFPRKRSGVGVRERGEREAREREREKRLHSPFALHAPIHQAILGGGDQEEKRSSRLGLRTPTP